MGDVPPKEGYGVEQIRKTEQVIDSRQLFSSFQVKRPAKQDLVILVAFLVNLMLLGGPLG